MKLLTFLLEPLQAADMASVKQELATLREGNGATWAIAEVIERILSVTEVVISVDVRRRKT
jgi:hypothetical protein